MFLIARKEMLSRQARRSNKAKGCLQPVTGRNEHLKASGDGIKRGRRKCFARGTDKQKNQLPRIRNESRLPVAVRICLERYPTYSVQIYTTRVSSP